MNRRFGSPKKIGGLLLLAIGGILLVKAIPGWFWLILLGGLLGWAGWFLYKLEG